jgi:ribosome maturation protein SDO1
MVSLDDAVTARLEKGGKRYEILVDPDLVDKWKKDHDSVTLDDLLAIDEVWHDAKNGDRPTEEKMMGVFGTCELSVCVEKILTDGSIQLTTAQRKKMVAEKRRQIINEICSLAIDPQTKLPHPVVRVENALDEARFSVDPFKPYETQVKDAVAVLRPLIPLSFTTVKLAFKIPGTNYGPVFAMVREDLQREEWLANGDWAFTVEVPAGMKNDYIAKVGKRAPDVVVKELK